MYGAPDWGNRREQHFEIRLSEMGTIFSDSSCAGARRLRAKGRPRSSLDRVGAAASRRPGGGGHERANTTNGNLFDPSYGMNSDPAASKGTKKSFILDPLLDSR